jgi:hypothetical protein
VTGTYDEKSHAKAAFRRKLGFYLFGLALGFLLVGFINRARNAAKRAQIQQQQQQPAPAQSPTPSGP